tara:strand:- start:22224 stop:23549 length:1326 start_codon:yes stop_codon:yes gene_type:complete
LYYKNLSLNNTYFDLGVYYSQLKFFNNADYWILFYGHFSPYIIFLSLIKKIFFFIEIDIMLIIVNCLIFFATALLISKHYSKLKFFIFIFFYPIYHSLLHDFHIEIIILPLCLGALILIDKEKYKLSYLFIFLIFLTKISLYFTIISLGVILYSKGKKKIGISFLSISTLIILIYYSFIRNEIIYTNNELLFSGLETIKEIINRSLYSYMINILLGIITISSSILLINYKKIFYKPLWLSITPIFTYYLLAGNTNYLLPIYHYFYQFIPFLIFYCFKEENLNKKINFNQLFISIISFIFLSISPISIMFYKDVRLKLDFNSFFDYKKGIKTKEIILSEINKFEKNSVLSISNNLVFKEYLDFKAVFPFGQDINGYVMIPNKKIFGKFEEVKINYFIIDKKSKYFVDNIINDDKYYSILRKYQEKYRTVFEDNDLMILKNEL